MIGFIGESEVAIKNLQAPAEIFRSKQKPNFEELFGL